MGNNQHGTGTGFALGGGDEITYAHPPKAFAMRGKVSEIQLMNTMGEEAVAYIRRHPREFIGRTARKILWFWTVTPADRVRGVLGAEAVRFRRLHLMYWTALVLLAALALIRRVAPPREYVAVGIVYAGLYSLLYGLTHVGQARYRGEIEFLLLPLAAAGIAQLLRSRLTHAIGPEGHRGAPRMWYNLSFRSFRIHGSSKLFHTKRRLIGARRRSSVHRVVAGDVLVGVRSDINRRIQPPRYR